MTDIERIFIQHISRTGANSTDRKRLTRYNRGEYGKGGEFGVGHEKLICDVIRAAGYQVRILIVDFFEDVKNGKK